jgi:hypothetical protein
VVAGDDEDTLGLADAAEPVAGRVELAREGQVRQVARHHHLVGGGFAQVRDQGVENVGVVHMPASNEPGQPAVEALAPQLRRAVQPHRRGVQVREVTNGEHGQTPSERSRSLTHALRV